MSGCRAPLAAPLAGAGGAGGGGGPSGGAGGGPFASGASASGASAPARRRPVASFLSRLLREQPLGAVGALVVLALVFITIFAAQLAPYEFDRGRVQDRMQGPSAAYLLGTDHVGRDLLSRLIFGARLSITVGLAATSLNVIVALLIGGTTGFVGGRVDIYAQRFVDAWMSFPGLLMLLTIMSIAGRGVAQIILVLGMAGGIPASRVVRAAVIGVKQNAYFQAAQAIGSSRWRSMLRHVLPNIAAPLIVVFSINVGSVIIAEASLSFLGFGLPASIPSWGGMLSREGRQYMEIAPRLALWPGLCLTVTVYALNLWRRAATCWTRGCAAPPAATGEPDRAAEPCARAVHESRSTCRRRPALVSNSEAPFCHIVETRGIRPTPSDQSLRSGSTSLADTIAQLHGEFALGWSQHLALRRRRRRSVPQRRAVKRQLDSSLSGSASIRRLAREGQIVEKASDLIKDPLVLEFLGLEERHTYSERTGDRRER